MISFNYYVMMMMMGNDSDGSDDDDDDDDRAVIKRQGLGIFPHCQECGPWLLS